MASAGYQTARVGDELPPLEITARNTAPDSTNKIHDDAEARRYGYGGGLVPGVTLYAYLTQLAVRFYGAEWLERGAADVSIRRPVYERERVVCHGSVVAVDRAGPTVELWATRDGTPCAGGRFSLATAAIASFLGSKADLTSVVDPLPELIPDRVPVGAPLAPLVTTFGIDDAAAYADETDDPNPWYRGDSPFGGPLVPPAWLAARQAPLLRANFEFGPSIHTRSVVHHLAPAFADRTYTTIGVIRETFERNGNHYLLLDATSYDDHDRAVFRVEHTSIFSVRQA